MNASKTNIEYVCLIHTDTYSGNFHRVLGSFITGFFSENDGDALVNRLTSVNPVPDDLAEFFQECVISKKTEFGDEICQIEQTPDKFYDPVAATRFGYGSTRYFSVSLTFSDLPDAALRELIKQRAEFFGSYKFTPNISYYQFKVLGIEYVQRTTTITEELLAL